jgi:hypothetical protein
MPLTDTEAEETFAFLSSQLRTAGLAWVLDQVAERIAYGKQVPIKESDLRRRSRRTGSLVITRAGEPAIDKSKQLTMTVPFTPVERVRILVRAILNAVVDVNAIENEILAFASQVQRSEVAFKAEEGESEASVTVSSVQVETRAHPVSQLKSLLAELAKATADAA